MPVYKNEDNGTWYVLTRYLDWKGERKQKCKRGFETKREAQEWERVFQQQSAADMDMNFAAFVELYIKDMKPRLKENTWLTKKHIIETKILPYFEKKNVSEITTKDVIAWQNELLAFRDEKKKPYSQTYLKTVHNQLSAIFNHAVRHYDLRSNPAAKAGNMGTEERKEMKFWTKDEYKKFADEMMDKPVSFYAFEMLYWCGIREGELLALTAGDFDFEKGTVTISKSYQRLHGEDVITTPKTKKSNRTIKMPQFLCEEMQDYIGMLYGYKKKDRIFPISKNYLHREMDRGSRAAGVKRIRIKNSGSNIGIVLYAIYACCPLVLAILNKSFTAFITILICSVFLLIYGLKLNWIKWNKLNIIGASCIVAFLAIFVFFINHFYGIVSDTIHIDSTQFYQLNRVSSICWCMSDCKTISFEI